MAEDNKNLGDEEIKNSEEKEEEVVENTESSEPNKKDGVEEGAGDSESPKVEEEKPKQEEELEKRFIRLQADFSNYKKRAEKEKQDIYKSAGARVISSMLPVIDDFERAIAHADESGKEAFIDGIKLIMKNFNEALVKEGLEYIDVKDADFDPNLHHAVMLEEVEGVESGKVIMEIQKGYKVSGKVVRPSMVKVSQ